MNNNNQRQHQCLGISKTIRRIAASDASAHVGRALREALLAARAVVNAVIENKEKKQETKLQKVTIE